MKHVTKDFADYTGKISAKGWCKFFKKGDTDLKPADYNA